ncbi:MAG: adenylate/guanylate cyclase domain-containing protein [Bacteroidota bacterium]
MQASVLRVLSVLLFLGSVQWLQAAVLPDSLQHKVDSLYALIPTTSDSLFPSLVNQAGNIYYSYYNSLAVPAYYETDWPEENIALLRRADTLAGFYADTNQWLESVVLLTNYHFSDPDTALKKDYFKRLKHLAASNGYELNFSLGAGLEEREREYFRISHNIWIQEDTSQSWGIEEILLPEQQATFEINPFRLNPYLLTREKVFWAKLRLRGQLTRDDDYYFMVGYEIFSWRDIEIYIPDSLGQYQMNRSGFFTPLEEKPLHDWPNYFSVFVPKGGEKTIYLRLANPTGIATPTDILLFRTNREQIKTQEAKNSHINGIFQGVVLVQGLFFLFWFFSTRSKVYLNYVLYLLSLAFFTIVANYFRQLFPQYPDATGPFFSAAAFFIAFGFIQFTFSLLRVAERKNGKLWRRILWIGLGIMGLALTASLFANIFYHEIAILGGAYTRLEFTSIRIGLAILFFFLIASVIWSIQAIKMGQKNAIYYLIANGLFVLGVSIPILSPIFDIDLVSFKDSVYSAQISIIVQLALFGLAVGQQQNQLEKEKRSALEDNLGLQKSINEATAKFVPYEFLRSLGRESILDVHLGDQVEKSVTVLFMDIRSYTTLSERMTPQENFAFLNAYLGRVGPLIKSNGGFVNQYYGDGIMAIFMGEAQDAWQATTAIQTTLITYNQERLKHQRIPIKVGMGLHSGLLMMGVIGDSERMDAGVVSDTVNTASRMEGLSKIFGADLILSASTFEALSEEAKQACRPLGKVKVKGKKSAIEIYEGALPAGSIKIQQKAAFTAALDDYRAGNIKTAIQKWEQLLIQNPQDQAISFYLEQCRLAEQKPVANAWDSVLRLDRK